MGSRARHRHRCFASFVAFVLLIAAAPGTAQVYRSVDESGNVTFSDQPPAGAVEVTPVEIDPGPSDEQVQAAQARAAPGVTAGARGGRREGARSTPAAARRGGVACRSPAACAAAAARAASLSLLRLRRAGVSVAPTLSNAAASPSGVSRLPGLPGPSTAAAATAGGAPSAAPGTAAAAQGARQPALQQIDQPGVPLGAQIPVPAWMFQGALA
jgi:hypothetical protein